MRKNNKDLPKIVAIGGGTGLPIIIQALKDIPSKLKVIVSVADDGYSSGRLRKDLGILPPGDIRNCLTAMASTPNGLAELFQYRFKKGELEGHSLGNLIIAALTLKEDNFAKAVKIAGKFLGCWGEVLPSTLENIKLVAETEEGKIVEGQFNIATGNHRLKKVFIQPREASAYKESVQAILDADFVIVGPGSLYTSLLPNLLLKEINQAIQKTKARCIYFCNLMTQPGETNGLDALEHLEILNNYVSVDIIDDFVVNSSMPDELLLAEYSRNDSHPVALSKEKALDISTRIHQVDLIESGEYIHHSPFKIKNFLENFIKNAFLY